MPAFRKDDILFTRGDNRVLAKIRKRHPLSSGVWSGDIRRKREVQDYMRFELQKVLRYSALRVEMGNITDAILAAALKELIADQILLRRSFDEVPFHVEYCLTEKGQSIVPILQSTCQWAGLSRKEKYNHTMAHCQKCDYHTGQEIKTSE